MIISMTDGTQTIQVDEDQRGALEARGFQQVGEPAALEPGQLVGHGVRVHAAEEAPLPPDHVPQMIQATDGHQTIWVDAAHTQRFATFLKRGFLPIPPRPQVEERIGMPEDEHLQLQARSDAEYDAQVAFIKAQAREKKVAS